MTAERHTVALCAHYGCGTRLVVELAGRWCNTHRPAGEQAPGVQSHSRRRRKTEPRTKGRTR